MGPDAMYGMFNCEEHNTHSKLMIPNYNKNYYRLVQNTVFMLWEDLETFRYERENSISFPSILPYVNSLFEFDKHFVTQLVRYVTCVIWKVLQKFKKHYTVIVLGSTGLTLLHSANSANFRKHFNRREHLGKAKF